MKLRVILACTLLLLAAVPTFALPLCKECDINLRCQAIPGAIERCYSGVGFCDTQPDPCSPPNGNTVADEWSVASIEISHIAPEQVADTAPAAPAEEPKATTASPTPAQK